MTSYPNFQVKLGETAAYALQADSQPTAVPDPNGRPGWIYVKDNTSQPSDKFNWYFYSGTYEDMKLKDVQSMSFLGSIDTWTADSKQAPFFIIYTKPTGSGDAGAFYHSAHAYTLNRSTNLIRAGERCQFWCIAKPKHQHLNSRLIEFANRIDTGTYDPESEVLYMTLHSDSAATEASVYCEELQANMHSFCRNGGPTDIQLKLIQ